MTLQVSVITTVLNRAGTIADALRSVQAQTWANVEHVVVDGGSTDGTLEVVEQHRERVAKFVSEPDRGIYDGLNKGIRMATGDVVGFLHADDAFASPQALERIARAFEDPQVGAVYGDLVYVNKDNASRVVRYWRAGEFSRKQLAHGWMPPHPTFYVRRGIYDALGAFDTRFRIAADYENILRILWQGRVMPAYVPEVLVRMRTGGASNSSLRNLARKSCEDFAALRQNGIRPLQAVVLKNVSKIPQFLLREPRVGGRGETIPSTVYRG